MRYMTLPPRYIDLHSSRMLHSVNLYLVTDVSGSTICLFSRIKQSKENLGSFTLEDGTGRLCRKVGK
jgi:hypothetical protein